MTIAVDWDVKHQFKQTNDFLSLDYISEVDRAEKADKEEKDAEQLFLTGNPENAGIVEIIKRVNKPEQLPVFYSGGFRVLKSLILTSKLFCN